MNVSYSTPELRIGAMFHHSGKLLTVRDLVYRNGRGLEIMTSCEDGYHGPSITRNVYDVIECVYMPSFAEEDAETLRVNASFDFPFAADSI
jgi:hypothetical protein